MNKAFVLFWLCTLVFNVAAALGDDLVRFPSGDAAWTVDIVYIGAAATPTPAANAKPPDTSVLPKKAKKIEVVRKDQLQKLRITWINSVVTERWMVPSVGIILEEDPRNHVIFPAHGGEFSEKWAPADLAYTPSVFNWIRLENLVSKEMISYRGKKCLRYDSDHSATDSNNPGAPKATKRSAWIDSETLLPVALSTETSVSLFTFVSPPDEPLTLPPKFQAELDDYKKTMGFR